MSYEVVWQQRAFDQVAAHLAANPSRVGAIAAAMRKVEADLADDPGEVGESRHDEFRVMFPRPLTVYFQPVPDERAVYVVEVHLPR